MDMAFAGELAINGALVGLFYALVGLGIVLIYKASGVVNLAQGALAMTGGYVAWAAASMAGLPGWAAVPVVLAAMFALGLALERVVLRRMTGEAPIMVIMVTLGVEIMLRGVVPGIWGADVKRLDLGIGQDPVFLGPMLINTAYLVGGTVSLALILAAVVFFGTLQGIVLRAVSDDQVAAWSVGIRVEHAIALAWGISGVTAASAGILWGSVQGVDWTLSLFLVKGLAVAILGGLDSVPGLLVAGLVVGVAESLVGGLLDPVVGGGTRDVVAAMIILLTVLVRPYGLFGRVHIERV
ncbi:branched-chain amino acid ABC transporter permease (plasmid) [Tistrella mobilis]|uniref:branched-chain amino acid ABC transporter permease n=1 Tax=Tistrella mobilis TaxID=171437 RepID=UPI0035561197